MFNISNHGLPGGKQLVGKRLSDVFVAFSELQSHGGVWFDGLVVSRNEFEELC